MLHRLGIISICACLALTATAAAADDEKKPQSSWEPGWTRCIPAANVSADQFEPSKPDGYVRVLLTDLNPKVQELTAGRVTPNQPLRCTIHCIIYNDHRLENVSVNESSSNQYFDSVCLAAVQSLQGSQLLNFVDKSLVSNGESIPFQFEPGNSGGSAADLPIFEIERLIKLSPGQIHQELLKMSKQ